MKRVYQTKFGPSEGNCFEACLASLLECSVEEIPSFNKKGGHWAQQCREFLAKRGLCYIEFNHLDPEAGYWIRHSGHSILSGPSPRGGCDHAIVAFQGVGTHDPHPDNTGLLSVGSIGFICLMCGGNKT